jgi:hypothetical protein
MNKLEKSSNLYSTLPFFLAGLGTGIALTLRLAPQSAANTRSLITTKVKDGEGWMRQKATENESAIVNSRS